MDAVGALKILQLLGLVLTVGSALFLAFIWQPAVSGAGPDPLNSRTDRTVRRRIRFLVSAGASLLLLAGCADLLRLGGAVAGTGPFSAAAASVAVDLIQTTGFGRLMLLRAALGMPLMAVVMWRSAGGFRRWAAALSLAVVLPISLTGHSAASGGVPALPVAADVLHLLLTAAWYGGLICLALVPWQGLRQPQEAPVLLLVFDRFSNLGLVAMGILGLTGVVLGSLRLYGPAALVEHPYGETLAWKLAMVATVMVPAAVNLLVVRPRLRHDPAERRPVRLFQGMLAAELAIGLSILLLAGRLATTEPPLGAPLRLSVTLQDGAIAPQRLEIPRNRPVLLTITNRGTQLHTFAVHNVPHRMLSGGHQHGASEDMVVFVEAGQTQKAQFVAYRSGTYQIYCMIEHHMDEGEQATLVVQP